MAKVKSITEKPEPSAPAATTPYSEMSDAKLRKKQLNYAEEAAMLRGDQSQAGLSRRVELGRLMRQIQDVLDLREPLIEVQVPLSATGEPFNIGGKEFHKGTYRVRKSVAEYLLWMISENQRIEMQRLQAKNRNINLGMIGERARLARIARDDGRTDDYEGRAG